MEKNYKETKRKYNSDKTFIQVSKELHFKMKEYCMNNGIKVKDYLEKIIKENI